MRRTLTHFVWFKVIEEESGQTEKSFEGVSKMCDISETGVGLNATIPVPVGKKVFLEIVTKFFKMSALGEIVYARKTEDPYFRVGVRFVIIPPNDRILLNRYLETKETE